MGRVLAQTGEWFRGAFVFFSSMAPFVENKGSILMGAAMGVKWYLTYLCSTLGALLPTPFLLRSGGALVQRLRRFKAFDKAMTRLQSTAEEHPKWFGRSAYLSLVLIISIPFTGIGVWAGCALSNLLQLDRRHTVWAVAAGVLISGLVTTLGVYGLVSGVKSLFGLA